jgi:DNA-directed RNA polymerase subunit RPC12/RpoP
MMCYMYSKTSEHFRIGEINLSESTQMLYCESVVRMYHLHSVVLIVVSPINMSIPIIKIILPESRYNLMVLIRCPECGANTDLVAAYYNVEDAEVRCSGCKAKLTVTLKNGEIKKLEAKDPGIG